VRYADDFVIMTNGSKDDTVALKEQAAEVLGGLGLRFSESKTRVMHLSEGIDFLGFRIQWKKRRGGGKWYCMVFIAGKAFAAIKQTIRNLTPRRSPRPLAEVILEVNAALRGWTYYPSWATLVRTPAGPVPRFRGLLSDSRSGDSSCSALTWGVDQAAREL
jgi:RNA-directed DNA polymerase